jgi:hypothetical protein
MAPQISQEIQGVFQQVFQASFNKSIEFNWGDF